MVRDRDMNNLTIYDWKNEGDFNWPFTPEQYKYINYISNGIKEIGLGDISDLTAVKGVVIDAFMRGKRIEQDTEKLMNTPYG